MALKSTPLELHRRLLGPLAARRLDGLVSRLGAGDADVVVSVCALCGEDDLDGAVARLRAQVPAHGELRFVEHVGRGDRLLTRVADRGYSVLPLGCHVGHDVPGALRRGGFTIVDLERFSMPSAVPLLRHWVRGVAR